MKKLVQTMVDKIFELDRRGVYHTSIARQVGCSRRTVIRTLERRLPRDNVGTKRRHQKRTPRTLASPPSECDNARHEFVLELDGREVRITPRSTADIVPLSELQAELKRNPVGPVGQRFLERVLDVDEMQGGELRWLGDEQRLERAQALVERLAQAGFDYFCKSCGRPRYLNGCDCYAPVEIVS